MSSSDLHMMADDEDVDYNTDNDEPVTVAFHESPDERPLSPLPPPSTNPSPSPPPPSSSSAVPPGKEPNGLLRPVTSVSSSTPAVTSVVLPNPLPTIKPVNISGGFPTAILAHALPDSPSVASHAVHVSTPLPSPPAAKAPPPALHPSAAAVAPSPYLYPPTPASGARVSAYAISLLTSGSIFRSYKLSPTSGQVEFQDIKLYAMFPASLTAASVLASSHSWASPQSPSASSASSSGPVEATLYWGPPNTRTSSPSPWHIPLLSITDIFKGKKSLLFHSTSPLVSLLSNSRCFTISSPLASLHLEAVTEQIREEWIARIVEIVRVVGGKHLQFSRTDEGEEEETRREKERRERLRHIQEIQAQHATNNTALLQRPPTANAATSTPSTASTDKEAEREHLAAVGDADAVRVRVHAVAVVHLELPLPQHGRHHQGADGAREARDPGRHAPHPP